MIFSCQANKKYAKLIGVMKENFTHTQFEKKKKDGENHL